MNKKIDYKTAGVDIELANQTISALRPDMERTHSSAVLNNGGGFAALYDCKALLHEYQHPVLVQSVDGIGTKSMIAAMMNQYQSLGADLVSACANDILVYGAKPLTLLDYIACDRLNPQIISEFMSGLVTACLEHNISLVGGETAEMPGVYQSKEYDFVGMITGVVEKDKIISGQKIIPGDLVFGFGSSGLHSNGYSLARRLLFQTAKWHIDSQLPELDKLLGEVLLEPHRNYTLPVQQLIAHGLPIKGMAHITGGGLLENIPRILPNHCAVELKKNSWPQQAIFPLLQALGDIDERELYRTFNMGIGYILIGDASLGEQANAILLQHPTQYPLHCIGQVVPGAKEVRLCV